MQLSSAAVTAATFPAQSRAAAGKGLHTLARQTDWPGKQMARQTDGQANTGQANKWPGKHTDSRKTSAKNHACCSASMQNSMQSTI